MLVPAILAVPDVLITTLQTIIVNQVSTVIPVQLRS